LLLGFIVKKYIIVLLGVEIGLCMIAAGAVVTRNVEPFSIGAGIPALVRGKVDLHDNVETISRKTTLCFIIQSIAIFL